MPNSLRFVELQDERDPQLPAWVRLYEAAFPPREKVPVAEHLEVLRIRREGPARLLAAVDADGHLLAMARYDLLEECPAAYLMYLAVTEERRGEGIGSEFYREIVGRLAREGRPLRAVLLEVERPDQTASEEEKRQAERRIAFYRRLGASLLEGIDYLQEVPGQPPLPMHLMVHPLSDPLDAEAAYALCAAGFGATRTSEPLRLS